jgi:hypothetical protein
MSDFKYDNLLEENLNLKKALASTKSILDRTLSKYLRNILNLKNIIKLKNIFNLI